MPIPKLDERDQLAILQTITGCSVTQRIKTVKQPRGGFLNPNLFEETVLDSPDDLAPVENIHASLVGLAVDYLTRFMTGSPVDEAFEISFKGAKLAKRTDTAHQLLSRIKGLDDDSIIAAAKLVTYDACYRNGYFDSNAVNSVNPDTDTCSNIRIMVNRALHFFDLYGPKTQDTMTFEGGYTHTVNAGDGDFMTADTLWDVNLPDLTVGEVHCAYCVYGSGPGTAGQAVGQDSCREQWHAKSSTLRPAGQWHGACRLPRS